LNPSGYALRMLLVDLRSFFFRSSFFCASIQRIFAARHFKYLTRSVRQNIVNVELSAAVKERVAIKKCEKRMLYCCVKLFTFTGLLRAAVSSLDGCGVLLFTSSTTWLKRAILGSKISVKCVRRKHKDAPSLCLSLVVPPANTQDNSQEHTCRRLCVSAAENFRQHAEMQDDCCDSPVHSHKGRTKLWHQHVSSKFCSASAVLAHNLLEQAFFLFQTKSRSVTSIVWQLGCCCGRGPACCG
jgi:hypothetical protein